MATLAEFYIVSTGIGFCYAAWGFLAGQIGSHGGGEGAHGHHGVSDHGFGHGDGAHDAGHGGHDSGGDSPDASSGDTPDMSAGGSHGSHGHGDGHGDSHGDSGDSPEMQTARHSAQAVRSSAAYSEKARRGPNVVGFLLKILSPMTIAMFLFYFGMTGVFITRILHLPDLLALLPAIICGYFGMKLTQAGMAWLISRMRTSSNFSETQIIGQIAQVSVSIPADKMGEIVFLVGKSRQNAPARAAQPGVRLSKETEVIITDVRDGVFYVEGWDDDTLDQPVQVIPIPQKEVQ